MKKSSLPLWVGAITLLLLSGCIKMDVQQTINTDKTSHIEVIYDASELVSYMTSMEDSFSEDSTTTEETTVTDDTTVTDETTPSEPLTTDEITVTDDTAVTTDSNADLLTGFDEACDTFLAETTWTNPTCVAEEYVFTMAGDISLLEDPSLTTNKTPAGTVYRYDLKNLFIQLSAVGMSQDQDFSDAALEEQKQYADMSGITLTYTLTMPGTITKADVGTISEDATSVSINLFDMAGMENAYVESTVKGTPWLYIGGGILLLVVITGGVMMMKGKKKPTPTV
ncbi:MAG: hypothetical protein WCW30_05525 [Candidatus Gracilibacteria bacterium]|jgi:hypothetical protein